MESRYIYQTTGHMQIKILKEKILNDKYVMMKK